MKLFSKTEMQSLESEGVHAGVSLWEMMAGAGAQLARAAIDKWGQPKGPAVVLCGKGNNGGDGFVCARELAELGAECAVLLLHGGPNTDLAAAAFARLPPSVRVLSPGAEAEAALMGAWLVVDCLFGFGFRGELDRISTGYLRLVNSLPCHRLAADLPSGAECDTGRVSPDTLRAELTIAFTGAKPAHESYPAKEYCGEVRICSVGIPPELVSKAGTSGEVTGSEHLRALLRPLDVQAHKGSQGRLLMVCGSWGMAGACVMAARAALRCGVGLLDIVCEERVYPLLAGAVPEAVFTVLDGPDRLFGSLKAANACVLGCGLGNGQESLIRQVLGCCPVPLVIDADGLNFCARTGFDLSALPVPHVITPHPGEAARLLGRSVAEIQAGRIPAALELAKLSDGPALLKGAATVTARPDGRFAINPTGNPGMAKGGSGDVLAGMIGAFLSQGAEPFEAARGAAYLHGLAGDRCRDRLSARGMLPTDLSSELLEIFKDFERD